MSSRNYVRNSLAPDESAELDSPEISICPVPCLFFHLLSHPLEGVAAVSGSSALLRWQPELAKLAQRGTQSHSSTGQRNQKEPCPAGCHWLSLSSSSSNLHLSPLYQEIPSNYLPL